MSNKLLITTDKDISDLRLKLETDEANPSSIHYCCSLWSIIIILNTTDSAYCRQLKCLAFDRSYSAEVTLQQNGSMNQSILSSMVESIQFYYININQKSSS